MRIFYAIAAIAVVSFTSHPAEIPELIYANTFSEGGLLENGWVELPGGFESLPPGAVQVVSFPMGIMPSSSNGRGIAATVEPGQVVFFYASNPIETHGHPIMLRITLQASSPWASTALVALRGNLSSGERVDGSLGLNYPAASSAFIEQERRLVVVYEPDQGDLFTPAIQVAGIGRAENDAATVWIDSVELFRLDSTYFGATVDGAAPPPTSMPSPTLAPSIDPTPTPMPGGVFDFQGLLSTASGFSVTYPDTFADVWRFTLSSRQEIVIDLMSDSFDAYLILYQGSEPMGDDFVADDDDGGEGFNSRLQITLEAGTYSIEATTFWSGESGAYTLLSTVPLAPAFMPLPTATPTPGSLPGETITIPLDLPDGATPLEMVLIPAGEFLMGSPEDEVGRMEDEGPRHPVILSRDYYMGRYEVTQAHYGAVIGENPSWMIGGNRPVESVSWFDAARFCNRLSELIDLQPVYDEVTWAANMNANGFRLPTEAEWEYACRAGTATRYYWGDDPDETQIGDYAWYAGNTDNGILGTQDVGLKQPNAFGLYDMSGNVWEWRQNWAYSYSQSDPIDPQGPGDGALKGGRGGSFDAFARECRSANRLASSPGDSSFSWGFRIVLSASNGGFTPPPIPTNTPQASSPSPTPTPTPTLTPPLVMPTATSTPEPATPTPDPGGQPGEIITIPLDLPDGAIPLEIIRIPAGEFIMGSPEDEIEHLVYQFGEESPREIYLDEGPQRRVTLSRALFIGRREVTWAQYYAIMGALPAGLMDISSNLPVWNVTWFDAARFCNRLSNFLGLDPVYDEIDWTATPNANGIRLPTEAEWEYACRAGTTTRYFWGDDPYLGPPSSNIDFDRVEIGNYAWVGGFSGGRIHEVGLKQPNAFGLYDMSGNVFEWCQDWFARYPDFDEVDPVGPQRDLQFKVARGGHALWHPYQARSAYRGRFAPSYDQDGDVGFRIARTP